MKCTIGHAGYGCSRIAPRVLLAMFALAFLAAPLLAQDPKPGTDTPETTGTGTDTEPVPTDPITVDFVQKDIHTVMHYIALRSGLQIIVEGVIDVKLTVMYRKVLPKDAIRSICKANELEYVEDGAFIIIKKRQQAGGLANVVNGEVEGRYHVAFESQELVQAIMEVAKVTRTQVYIPTLPEEPASGGGTGQPTPVPSGGGTEGGEQRAETRVQRIQKRNISMFMRDADPDSIMERLAEVGGLLFKKKADGYHFEYAKVRNPDEAGSDPVGDGVIKMTRKDWILPGVDVVKAKSEVSNLLSTRGRIVVDEQTRIIMVIDRDDVIDNVSVFLDKVGAEALEVKRVADALADDPMVVQQYSIVRDAADQALLSTLATLLSTEGRVSLNPETNSIVVLEHQSRMANLTKFITGLDTMPQQVLIQARLVEVSVDSYMGYGLQLFSSQPVDNWKDGVLAGDSRDSTQGSVGGLFGNPTGFDPFVGTFVNDVINARLELLANDGKLKTLSQPKQMVSNRKPARIEVGQEIPYVQNTTSGTGSGTTNATVSFKEVSLIMDVTPTIFETGIIRLQITVTVREVIGNTAIQGNNTPILSKRESRTDVYLRDGETMVMGGLLRERERVDENGLPFLKDIPFLGYLFKSTNKTVNKTDLMFFLRPTIVNSKLPGGDSRNGSDLARDLTPAVDLPEDADKASIRPGGSRKLEKMAKPAHYSDNARPKKPADVKPGA